MQSLDVQTNTWHLIYVLNSHQKQNKRIVCSEIQTFKLVIFQGCSLETTNADNSSQKEKNMQYSTKVAGRNVGDGDLSQTLWHLPHPPTPIMATNMSYWSVRNYIRSRLWHISADTSAISGRCLCWGNMKANKRGLLLCTHRLSQEGNFWNGCHSKLSHLEFSHRNLDLWF